MLKVFHPTDLSREGEPAFAHALRIAYAGESQLTVLHVDGLDEHTPWEAFPSVRGLLERWNLLEPGSPRAAVQELGIEVEKIEAHSRDTVRAILRYLDSNPADVIVLATSGKDGLSAWWEGSVAEPVARVSRTMSLFVPHGVDGFVSSETGDVSLQNILVPVCSEPDHAPALTAATAFVAALGVSEPTITACFVGDETDCPGVGDDEATMMIRQGAVADEIVAAADEVDADLMVMTTEGRHGILDALRGSTTEQVLRRARCPLLAVPAIAGAD